LGERGADVVGVSRRTFDTSLPAGVSRWISADLAEPDECVRVMREAQPDIVFHLAGVSTGSRARELLLPTFWTNVVSTVYLMDAALDRSACFVQVGSQEEVETDHPVAASPYAASKTAATTYLRLFSGSYGLDAIIARVFVAYGPGPQNENKVIPYVIRSFLDGREPELASGARPMDWVYLDDVSEGLIRIAERRESLAGQRVDIGTGTLVTVRDVVHVIERLMGPPRTARFGSLTDRGGDPVRAADNTATERQIGWTPAIDLEEGLRRTVAWFRAHATT
jgi:nucleoside-diphosphate-sugar epimerase